MPKTYRANHSLWPEQARPRSTRSSALAIGSFCIGIVAAFSANSVLNDLFVSPPQDAVQQSVVADVPAYAMVTPPAPPKVAEPVNSTRSRLAVSKLPTIGTLPTPAAIDTDGRGAAASGRSSESLTDSPAVAAMPPSTPPTRMAEAAKPADEPQAATSAPQPKPVARERVQKHRTAQKRRDQSTHHASRNRNNPFFPFFGFFGQRG